MKKYVWNNVNVFYNVIIDVIYVLISGECYLLCIKCYVKKLEVTSQRQSTKSPIPLKRYATIDHFEVTFPNISWIPRFPTVN